MNGFWDVNCKRLIALHHTSINVLLFIVLCIFSIEANAYPPSTPSVFATKNNTTVTIEWNDVSRCNGPSVRYEIRESTNESNWNTVYNGYGASVSSSQSLSDVSVKGGFPAPNPCGPPTGTSIQGTETLSTNAISVKAAGGILRHTLTNRTGGHYYYQIRGCTNTCSAFSASREVLSIPPIPQTISVPTSTVKNGVIAINWSTSSGAHRYLLQEKTNSSSWLNLDSVSGTSIIRSKGNGQYQYRVKACTLAGCSTWRTSGSVKVLLPPSPPSSISVPSSTVTNGSIAVSWPAVSTATKYTLQESANSGSWSTLHDSSSRSYTRSGRSNGNYVYRVRACNSSGCSGWRTSGSITVLLPPPAPASVEVPASSIPTQRLKVTWSNVNSANYYQVNHRNNSGTWQSLGNANDTSSDSPVLTQGVHQFRVRSCNQSGCGGWKESTQVEVGYSTEGFAQTFTGIIVDGYAATPSNIPASDNVGTLKGAASVSGGKASYHIPIEIAPGRKNVQPSVSLNYTSNSGSGIAGVGWSIGAGSSIYRCNATYAQDGFTHNVQYDALNDRLCLDG